MTEDRFSISGNIVDVINHRIFNGTVMVEAGRIARIIEQDVEEEQYILPGLVDAHIHIESSMLIPSEFARISAVHGTVATVSDPHEIANVLGMDGIDFMIRNGEQVPFKFHFGAPPCVPATGFESSGSTIGVKEIEDLLRRDDILYMAEMMNYPGVLYRDKEVWAKLDLARKYGKPVDRHAPGLKGEEARTYAGAGITTDHECFTLQEALDKIASGMHILVREGSAARNLEALVELVNLHPDRVMFCSDDRHPDDLLKGHMDSIIRQCISMGYDPITILRCCTYNPVMHYGLDVGVLREGDSADLVIVDNLESFTVKRTYISGVLAAENGEPLIEKVSAEPVNRFVAHPISESDIAVRAVSDRMRVIEAIEGQLITRTIEADPKVQEGNVVSDLDQDVLKMVVLNRYQKSRPSVGFIKGFGLKEGAIASTVAHDSHNIIALGASDEDIIRAINLLIESRGGISCVNAAEHVLPLAFGGIMSGEDALTVSRSYQSLDKMAKGLGCTLQAPFMTLSFMALLVIPELKLSDKGLFDGRSFSFTSLFK